MSNVEVNVVEEKEKKGLWGKVKGLWDRTPKTVLDESNRFSRLGYLDYPKKMDRHLRLFYLMQTLEEMELTIDQMATMTDKQKYKQMSLHNKKLHRTFMTIGSPWIRGLDNRELAQKQNDFFELEMMIGHLPAFYPDLKLCTDILIGLSWQAIDVTPETPVLMETRATLKGGQGLDLSGEVEEY